MRIARAIVATLALFALGAAAAPPAGTVIGNQATATYNDAGGVARTATSNLVQTTVSQVKSFALAANGARTAAPGQTVYYPHTITNAGNGTDSYTLDAPVSGIFAGAAAPHGSLAYYADANGDGVPDNATPITGTGPIAAGGAFRFVVAGTVPATAASGNTAVITVSVTDTAPNTATNTDTTTVANSVIGMTKALSSGSGPSPAGPITVTISYANTGTAAANAVQVTDILQPGFTYVPGSGRWSVSGATPLTDANDGVEATGIDFRFVAGTVTATIPSVAAGLSGTVSFQLNVNANLAPQVINNTAQYQTASQPAASSNTAAYTVLQTAAVVANGSNTVAANGTGEPVTLASGAAGAVVTFNNYVWNRGNGTDTFDVTVAASTFPAGSTITLLQHDGATTLVNSAGGAAPDTGPIPGAGQPCPAPLVTDGTFCGYRVVVRVTLPASAAGGPFTATLRATSAFNTAVFDDVADTLLAVTPNTVDVTNDRAAPPAGAATVADGLGATGTAVVRTLAVSPGAAAVVSRFQVWVTNTGAVADTFTLAAAAVAPLPPGWSVAMRADGGAGNCSTVGAATATSGVMAAGAGRLFCAEITTPPLASGNAPGGNYDFDFTATSQTNPSVNDVKRDRLAVAALIAYAVDVTNDRAAAPAGAATAADGLGASGTTVVRTANVVPGAAPVVTRFQVWVTNTGALADTYDLLTSAAPAGWSVAMRADGGAGNCSTVGAAAAVSGVVNAGSARLFCAEVTVPGLASGNAGPGNYDFDFTARSQASPAVADVKRDRVTVAAVTANGVDLTNDRAAAPAGTATVADGQGGTGTTVIRSMSVVPGVSATVTRFQLWVTNTGALADTFNLGASLAASTAPGVVAPTMPAGWSLALRADGGAGDCSTVGAVVAATGLINPGAARLFCAEVTISSLASGTAVAGDYDFDFTVASQANAAVGDLKRDRLSVTAVPGWAITTDVARQVFPGGSAVYSHTLRNTGNVAGNVTFPSPCLADSRAAQGWASAAFEDTNGNGTFEAAGDAPVVCGAGGFTLNPGESRLFFVRATAPATATAADPANTTTFNLVAGGAPLGTQDATTVTQGLTLAKSQQVVSCSAAPAAAGYSAAPIAAAGGLTPGGCIAYRIVVTNVAAAPIDAIVIGDAVPANTRMHYACSGNGQPAPSVTAGSIAGTTPAHGATGTVAANVGTLAPSQSASLFFCVRVDP